MPVSADQLADFLWSRRFVARADPCHPSSRTSSSAPLASLISEHIVFRSPFVQSPIPGRPAAAADDSRRRNDRIRGRAPPDQATGCLGLRKWEPDWPATEPAEGVSRRPALNLPILMASLAA